MFFSYLAGLLQGSQSSGRFLPRNSQLQVKRSCKASLAVNTYSAHSPLLLLHGGGCMERCFIFLINQGSPWELFCYCFLFPSPPPTALFADFLPPSPTLFAMLPQAHKFQVQTMSFSHHSSTGAAFHCSPILSPAPQF